MPANNDLVLIRSQLLTDIANAIRTKTGKSETMYPANMDTEILSIDTEAHPPITVNITQSEHQTITAISQLTVNNGKITCPNSIVINASIIADDGYTPGALNQTSVNAVWGSTVSFYAEPATVVEHAEIHVTLTADPTSDVAVGDEIAFTGTVRNEGNVSVTNGSLSSELVNLSEETFNLAPGEQHSFEYSYTAAQEDIDAGEIIDTVTASASSIRDWDPESVTASATVTCEEVEASLSIALSAFPTSNVMAGDEVTFTGTVRNTGNVSVTNGSLSSELVDLSEETFNLAPDETYNFEYNYTVTQEDVTYGSVTGIVLANASAMRGDDPEEVDAKAIVTLSRETATLTINTNYSSPDYVSCSYSGTVAGKTVSGVLDGTLTFTEYYGETYNLSFNSTEGYDILPSSSLNGTFTSSMYPVILQIMVPPTPPAPPA